MNRDSSMYVRFKKNVSLFSKLLYPVFRGVIHSKKGVRDICLNVRNFYEISEEAIDHFFKSERHFTIVLKTFMKYDNYGLPEDV